VDVAGDAQALDLVLGHFHFGSHRAGEIRDAPLVAAVYGSRISSVEAIARILRPSSAAVGRRRP